MPTIQETIRDLTDAGIPRDEAIRAAREELQASTTFNARAALNHKRRLLEQHGIEYRVQGDQLFALDVSTHDGKPRREWADVTRTDIKYWLGY